MARKSKRNINAEETVQQQEKRYSAAIYTRLSVDENMSNSESISNQKAIIYDYLKNEPDIEVYGEYTDNGMSGTNFDRADFRRMIYDMYNGNINCIIVKDLSRFGREYIEAGEYIERVFPMLGVRFISINDKYDNKINLKDISLPIKNIVNSLYAKDISKKVISAINTKQKNGEFLAHKAPYGYIKSPEERHRLIIDFEASKVVRKIFELKSEHISYREISRRLYEMRIAPPMYYAKSKNIKLNDTDTNTERYWSVTTIKNILKNETYIGSVVQGKTKSCFSEIGIKKNIYRNKEDWIVVRGTHEAIIEKELFYKVQSILENVKLEYLSKNKNKKRNTKNVFRGKLICGVCGCRIDINKTKRYKRYVCQRHKQFKTLCDFKGISQKTLKEIVSKSIRLHIAEMLNLKQEVENIAKSEKTKTKLQNLKKSINLCVSNIEHMKQCRMYAVKDYVDEKISEIELNKIIAEYSNKIENENKKLNELKEKQKKQEKRLSTGGWLLDLIKYKSNKNLSKEMVNAFVEQIKIYEDKRLEIKWNFVDKEREILYIIEEEKNNG